MARRQEQRVAVLNEWHEWLISHYADRGEVELVLTESGILQRRR